MAKIKNKKQLAHGAADSKVHKEDKMRNEARRDQTLISVLAKTEEIFGFSRNFELYLDKGMQFRVKTGEMEIDGKRKSTLIAMNTDRWIIEHEEERQRRGWYHEERERKGADGVKKKVVKPRSIDPFSDLLVTLAPWTQAFLFITLKFAFSKGKERVLNHLYACLSKTINVVEERTGNEVLFANIHSDTDDLHMGLRPCCVSKNNQRIGEPWMRTVGPAAVGYSRQIKMGAGSSLALQRYLKSMEIYQTRAVAAGLNKRIAKTPLDIELANVVDRLAEVQFGMDPIFQKSKECYHLFAAKKQVSLLSRKQLEEQIRIHSERLKQVIALEERHKEAVNQMNKPNQQADIESGYENTSKKVGPEGGDDMKM